MLTSGRASKVVFKSNFFFHHNPCMKVNYSIRAFHFLHCQLYTKVQLVFDMTSQNLKDILCIYDCKTLFGSWWLLQIFYN